MLREEIKKANLKKLYEWIGKPKVVVVGTEKIDKVEEATQIAQIELERLLKANHIDVYDMKQLEKKTGGREEIYARFKKNPKDIYDRYGVQLVFEVNCTSSYRGSVEIDPSIPRIHDYTTQITIRAYRTTTAWLFTPQSYDDVGERTETLGDTSHRGAALKSIKYVLKENMQATLESVLGDWRRAVIAPRALEIVIERCEYADLRALMGYVRKLEGVEKVREATIQISGKIGSFGIDFVGVQTAFLDEILSEHAPLKVELVRAEEDRIALRLLERRPVTGKPPLHKVRVADITLAEFEKLAKAVEKDGRVGVERREYEKEGGVIEAEFDGSAGELAEILEELSKGLALVTIGVSRKGLDLMPHEAWVKKQEARQGGKK